MKEIKTVYGGKKERAKSAKRIIMQTNGQMLECLSKYDEM